MDSIKKKMRTLASTTEEADARAKVFDEECRATNEIAEKFEEQVRGNIFKIFPGELKPCAFI